MRERRLKLPSSSKVYPQATLLLRLLESQVHDWHWFCYGNENSRGIVTIVTPSL